MGREIRRVPPGWEHPVNDTGQYKPMLDTTYKIAAENWIAEFMAWEDDTHPDLQKNPALKDEHFFWDWNGAPPGEDGHRPEFTEEPTHYQVYENVSEGTPTSPVLPNEEAIVDWLIKEGHSRESAEGFVKMKWCPSMIVCPGKGIVMGIDSCGADGVYQKDTPHE